ncbi:MAG: hypothetical protein V3T47_06385 [Gammaproteobacteria bacterium]
MNDVARTQERAVTVREIAPTHDQRPGALLPLLHAIQDQAKLSEVAKQAIAQLAPPQ